MADLSLEKTLKRKASVSRLHRKTRWGETVVQGLLFFSGFFSIFTTLGIVYELGKEALLFFQMPEVNLLATLTTTEWKPHIGKFGIWPLLNATLMTTLIAMLIAIPLGMAVAIYLSEYAKPKVRNTLKPILEVLAGIPTIVYGYFALLFVTPLLQQLIPSLPGFNLLSAGIVMGIMIIPTVSSVSEDAMRAVPMALREGSYAMGATRFQTAIRVVTPAAFSGIAAAYILGISRAVGETMILAVAAGMQPNLTWNPLEPAATITAYIVQVALGDLPHGSIGYQTIFAAGLTLALVTLLFNVLGHVLRKRYRQAY